MIMMREGTHMTSAVGGGRDLQKAEEITEVASTMYEGEGEFQKTETFEDIICVCP